MAPAFTLRAEVYPPTMAAAGLPSAEVERGTCKQCRHTARRPQFGPAELDLAAKAIAAPARPGMLLARDPTPADDPAASAACKPAWKPDAGSADDEPGSQKRLACSDRVGAPRWSGSLPVLVLLVPLPLVALSSLPSSGRKSLT